MNPTVVTQARTTRNPAVKQESIVIESVHKIRKPWLVKRCKRCQKRGANAFTRPAHAGSSTLRSPLPAPFPLVFVSRVAIKSLLPCSPTTHARTYCTSRLECISSTVETSSFEPQIIQTCCNLRLPISHRPSTIRDCSCPLSPCRLINLVGCQLLSRI